MVQVSPPCAATSTTSRLLPTGWVRERRRGRRRVPPLLRSSRGTRREGRRGPQASPRRALRPELGKYGPERCGRGRIDPGRDIEANGGAPRTVFRKKREKNGKKEHVAKPAPKPVPPRHARSSRRSRKCWRWNPGVASPNLSTSSPRRWMAPTVVWPRRPSPMRTRTRTSVARRGGGVGASRRGDDEEDVARAIEPALGTGRDLNQSLYELHTLFRKGAKRATATGEGGVDAPNVGKKMKKAAPELSPNPRKRRRGRRRDGRGRVGRGVEDGQEEEEESEEEDAIRTTNRTMRMNPTRVFTPPRTIPWQSTARARRRRSPTRRMRTTWRGGLEAT